VTAAVTAAFITSAPAKHYVYSNPWTFWTALGASFGLLLVLACSESARRSHPLNLLLLLAFTLAESFFVATASAMYDTDVVLIAAALTAGVTLCLAAYAMQTKRDFTAAGGVLFTLLFCLVAAGVLGMFFRASWYSVALSCGGALLFSAYIIVDVQLLMGGHKVSISPDEYVFASLNIFLDILNLYLYLLRLVDAVNRRS
jgi:hypothetical protein